MPHPTDERPHEARLRVFLRLALRYAMLGAALAAPAASAETLRLDLTQAPQAQDILPGPATNGWSYTGTVQEGPASALVPVPGSYLGPTIHAGQGDNLTIRLTNLIGEDSTTHWHGLDVPDRMDGHPRFAFASGSTYEYSFRVLNRAGTYWYHPHPDMRTGGQVYAGLAGFFIVHDAQESSLNLPGGDFDLPLCIQDASFDAGNQRVYNPDMTNGFFGTTILVNGKPDYVQSAATRVYRLRLLNGSVSRIYKLAFSNGMPLVVIGNDGGLIDVPRPYPYVMLAPGERVELWADFRGEAPGSQVTLRSLAFNSSGGQGAALDIMRFSIDHAQAGTETLPATLSTITPYQLADAINAANPKLYAIAMAMVGGNMSFTLNGATFSTTAVAANEVAMCNTLEVIAVSNTSGMMPIPHPIHFHGRQFQILDRKVTSGGLAGWNTVKDGLVDAGWKDTFLIMPGETVRLLVRHGGYPGLYNYHCHNLEHEDMGMMRNFRLDANPDTPCDLNFADASYAPVSPAKTEPWVYTKTCAGGDVLPELLVPSVAPGSDVDNLGGGPGTMRLYQLSCGCAKGIYLSKQAGRVRLDNF